MRIFLYEYVTGGGWWCEDAWPPTRSLLEQGRAMIRAVSADFAGLPELQVLSTGDVRLAAFHPAGCEVSPVASSEEELAAIGRLAAAADWTLLIAPETSGALLRRCRLIEHCGGRLLSPSADCAEMASSKHATAEWLRKHGIPVPRGRLLSAVQGFEGLDSSGLKSPIVIKPDDGCGSDRIQFVSSNTHHSRIHRSAGEQFRIEEFTPGLAASVAVLCGPAGNHALPACEQRLSADGQFTYLGGRLPLTPELDRRARRLALAAVAVLPQPIGYIGVDLVLGEAADGVDDRVIEINPRLTMSYIGLRAASRTNLAEAMLAAASGQSPDLCFDGRHVEFTADGTVNQR